MTRILLKKCLRDSQWLLAGCMSAIFAFCWLRVWIVGLLDTRRFQAILDLLPSEWQRFTPVDFGWLITYTGRIALAYDELIVVMCVMLWAIARGSDSVSGELGRGTLEMLLAQPLSRLQVLVTQAAVTVVGIALLATSAWLGTSVGVQLTTVREEIPPAIILPFALPGVGDRIPLPFGEPEIRHVSLASEVDVNVFLPASMNLFCLGVMLAGVTTFVSAWDRYRWRTIGIVAGFCIVQLMIKIAGMAAEPLNGLLYLSVFTAYEPEAFVRLADVSPELIWSVFLYDDRGNWVDYGPLWYCGLLTSIGLLGYTLAGLVFCRRDLPAPL